MQLIDHMHVIDVQVDDAVLLRGTACDRRGHLLEAAPGIQPGHQIVLSLDQLTGLPSEVAREKHVSIRKGRRPGRFEKSQHSDDKAALAHHRGRQQFASRPVGFGARRAIDHQRAMLTLYPGEHRLLGLIPCAVEHRERWRVGTAFNREPLIGDEDRAESRLQALCRALEKLFDQARIVGRTAQRIGELEEPFELRGALRQGA